jgi:hypothetical protein
MIDIFPQSRETFAELCRYIEHYAELGENSINTKLMAYSSIKSKLELECFLKEKLSYYNLSKMTFEEYVKFVNSLFYTLNVIRKNGIQREDLFDFVQNLYSDVMSDFDDSDVLFERRFSIIVEELIAFTSDPIFWYSDFDVYMKKWDELFKVDWLKRPDRADL